jgi:hypothetical protein
MDGIYPLHKHGKKQEALFRKRITHISVLQASAFAENCIQGISLTDRTRPTA